MKTQISLLFVFIFMQSFRSQSGLCFNNFQALPNYMMSFCLSMSSADFNSDGQADICTESLQGVKVLLSTGNGNYSSINSFTLGCSTDVVACADFNNDGKADIAALTGSNNTVWILSGDGIGGFSSVNSFLVDSVPVNLVISDFNNDGKKDIATVNKTAGNVSILISNGAGSFLPSVNYMVGAKPSLIICGDFNNNGAIDLFVVSATGASILKGSASGTFVVAPGGSIVAKDLLTLDVNSDSKLDLIYVNGNTNVLSVMNGNGNFVFTTSQSYSVAGYTSYGPKVLSSGDFNNDGKADLAMMSVVGGVNSVLVFAGTSTGAFSQPLGYQASPSTLNALFSILVIDVNTDGKDDILCSQDNAPGILNSLLNCNSVAVGHTKEIITEFNFKLFPNPANDYLQFALSDTRENIFRTVSIYNNLGQLVAEEIENFNADPINLKNLPEGVYSLVLRSDGAKPISKRFVIAR